MLLLIFSPNHEIIDPAKHLPNLDWQLFAVTPAQHHSKIQVVWICLIEYTCVSFCMGCFWVWSCPFPFFKNEGFVKGFFHIYYSYFPLTLFSFLWMYYLAVFEIKVLIFTQSLFCFANSNVRLRVCFVNFSSSFYRLTLTFIYDFSSTHHPHS